MVIIASIAWSKGNPQLLAAPFDSTGTFFNLLRTTMWLWCQCIVPIRLLQ